MNDFGPPVALFGPLDHWRLCDELSVVQAALLIVGKDPSGVQDLIEHTGASSRPKGYDAAKAALINSVNGKRLAATVVNGVDKDGWTSGPDWHQKSAASSRARSPAIYLSCSRFSVQSKALGRDVGSRHDSDLSPRRLFGRFRGHSGHQPADRRTRSMSS